MMPINRLDEQPWWRLVFSAGLDSCFAALEEFCMAGMLSAVNMTDPLVMRLGIFSGFKAFEIW